MFLRFNFWVKTLDVDLAPYEITMLQKLLREQRQNREIMISDHEGHFPKYVRRIEDIDANAVSHCHNRWCSLGQINILLDKLEEAWKNINEDVTVPSYQRI